MSGLDRGHLESNLRVLNEVRKSRNFVKFLNSEVEEAFIEDVKAMH